MRRRIAFFLASALLLVSVSPVAAVGKPTVDRVNINDVGVYDDFLSGECGFDVWSDTGGHITFRLFNDAAGNPRREVNNYAVRVHYYSENGDVYTRDVGPDRARYLDDGSILLTITGNVQPVTAPGQGRVNADSGQTTVLITFDENGDPQFEDISQHGNHMGADLVAVLCGLLD
jgi:hypothetical protein